MGKKIMFTCLFLVIILFICIAFYNLSRPKINLIARIEGYISDFMIDNNKNIYICGDFTKFNKIKINDNYKNIIEINLNGKVSKTFDQRKIFDDKINLSIQKIFPLSNDNFIIIYDYLENSILKTAVAKFNSDYVKIAELVSNSFTVNAVAVQDDGKILLGGKIFNIGDYYPFHILRLNEDLTIDNSFDTSKGFNKQVYDIIYKDSKIYVVGEFSSYKSIEVGRIVRLNLDGQLDNSFAVNKGANSDIFDIDIDEKGNIYIAGMFTYFDDKQKNVIARLNPDNQLDEKFNPITSIKSYLEESGDASFTKTYDFLPKITKIICDDRKIIIAGNFSRINDIENYKLARIGKNLQIDKSFNLSLLDILKKTYSKNTKILKEVIKDATINKIVLLDKNTYLISVVFPFNSLIVKIKTR